MRLFVIAFLAMISFSTLMNAQDCESSMHYFPLDGISSYEGISMDTTIDNGYIAGAAFNSDNNGFNLDITIFRIDAFGNEVWATSVGWEGHERIAAIRPLPDGGFIVLGSTSSASQTPAEGSILLFKLNANGELLWTSVIGTDPENWYFGADLKVLPDGGFLLATTERDQLVSVIMKTDANGNLLHQTIISPPVIDEAFTGDLVPSSTTSGDIFIAANGDYIFSARSLPRTFIWPAGGYTTVVRMTPDLNLVWQWVGLFSQCYPLTPQGAVEYPDGSLYITVISDYGGCIDGGSVAGLLKFDPDGNFLWVESTNSNYAGDILLAPDGNLIVSKGNGIMKMDTSGTVLWQSQEVSYFGTFRPNSANHHTTNGGYMLAVPRSGALALVEFDSLGNHCTSFASGIVFIDEDQDCVKDSSESFVQNAILEVTPGNIFANTDHEGVFRFLLDTGNFNLQLHPPNALWEVGCPLTSTYDLSFPTPYLVQNNLNFGLHAVEDCALLNIDVSLPRARVCTEQTISVQYCNDGTIAQMDAVIEIELDEMLAFQNATLPWTQTDNVYSFAVGTLAVGSCGEFNITVFVDCDAAMDSTACITARILPENTCSMETGHDKDADCRTVTNSFDPNDKLVAAADTSSCWETALDELAFTIRFQNTGNDTAYRVVILDTLSNVLDLSTVRPGPSSHGYEFKVRGQNEVMFIFNNINLVDSTTSATASQGFVQFFIHPKSSIPENTVIENQAAIYFDTNDPIFTPPAQLTQCSEIPLTVIDVVTTPVINCLVPDATLSIYANGGAEGYEYSINGGETWQDSPDFLNLSAGDYYIQVRDTEGAITDFYQNPVAIKESLPLILDVLIEDPSSCDGENGELQIVTDFSDNPLFSIDGGLTFQSTPLFTALPEGDYQLIVHNQCQRGDTITAALSDPLPPSISNINWVNPSCNLNNGYISIATTGELLRYYSIDGGENWSQSHSNSGLPPGDYQVIVSYGPGNCEVAYDSTITLIREWPYVIEDLFTQDPGCDGTLGAITILANSEENLLYSIDMGMNWQDFPLFTNLQPGDYTIIVNTQNFSCADTLEAVNIAEVDIPVLQGVNFLPPTNSTATDGSIEIQASGSEPLLYSINQGATWQSSGLFTNLPEGTYYPWTSWTDNTCIVMGDSIVLTAPTGTLDFTDANIQSLTLFPNPAREMVQLNMELKQPEEVKWAITAVTGEKVWLNGIIPTTTQPQAFIPIEKLPAGVYVVHIHLNGQEYARKLVVY